MNILLMFDSVPAAFLAPFGIDADCRNIRAEFLKRKLSRVRLVESSLSRAELAAVAGSSSSMGERNGVAPVSAMPLMERMMSPFSGNDEVVEI